MKKKFFIMFILLIILISTIFLLVVLKKSNNINVITPTLKNELTENNKTITDIDNSDIANNKINKNDNKQILKHASVELDDTFAKKANLYNSDSGSLMPLSTISIIADLPQNIQDKVSKIAETNNIFMSKKSNDRLLLITDNPDNIRHCVEFTEISLSNGHQVKTTLGYNDKIKDSDNDIWEYDDNTKLPTRHTKYNKEGDVEFTEVWNYNNENPIKYEMKDSEGNVISLRKETLEGGTNLRVEHLIYDKAGNTKVNVSATYDGADVKRFTYYNADKPSDGGSVFAEYTDGLKTKETLYSNDLKVINTYTSEYKNGEREDIIIWDNQNNQIKKLISNEEHETL